MSLSLSLSLSINTSLSFHSRALSRPLPPWVSWLCHNSHDLSQETEPEATTAAPRRCVPRSSADPHSHGNTKALRNISKHSVKLTPFPGFVPLNDHRAPNHQKTHTLTLMIKLLNKADFRLYTARKHVGYKGHVPVRCRGFPLTQGRVAAAL